MKTNSIRRSRKRGVAVAALASSLALAGAVFAPTMAQAQGNFNVSHTAWGCQSGQYQGSSNNQTTSTAYWATAYTAYFGNACVPSAHTVPGARAIAGTTMGPWQYSATSTVTTRIQKANAGVTPYGHHNVGGGYQRNT